VAKRFTTSVARVRAAPRSDLADGIRVGGLTGPPVGSEPDAWTSVGIHPA